MININDLVESHWDVMSPILTGAKSNDKLRGRPRCGDLKVLQAILWVLRSGARWEDLPECYPSYKTCHRRFQQWVSSGAFRRLLKKLVNLLEVDVSEVYVDGCFFPAKKGGKLVGKCLKGKGSKLLLLLDRTGKPISMQLESASPHEVKFVPTLVKHRWVRAKPIRILGDKAYDSDPLDRNMRAMGIEMIAPNRDCRLKKNQDRRNLRRMKRRWTIERYFSWLKSFRRLVVRWERYPENFDGMLTIASILLVLRHF